LRGTPFMYYGEEIGMRDIHLRRSEILDPAGRKYWPIYKGRDGCRSPMQWNDSAYAGFSTARPWLPVHPDYTRRNVNSQQGDSESLFNFTKKLLALRRQTPALHQGDFIPMKAPSGSLAYLRRTENQSVFVTMNFCNRKIKFVLPRGNWRLIITTSKGLPGMLIGHEIQLYIME